MSVEGRWILAFPKGSALLGGGGTSCLWRLGSCWDSGLALFFREMALDEFLRNWNEPLRLNLTPNVLGPT